MRRMQTKRALGFLLLVAVLGSSAGCKRLPRPLRSRSRVATVTPAQRALPTLANAGHTELLTLTQFSPAVVELPVHDRYARPAIVVFHGDRDQPRETCSAWREITGDEFFVVCPALAPRAAELNATPIPCPSPQCAASELKEVLVALRKQYGQHVAPKQVMLVGMGRGAEWAQVIAQQNPKVFPILWLVDGGFEQWTSSQSYIYSERGGQLLGVVCSTLQCQGEATRIVASAHAVGLKTADFRAARGTGQLDTALINSLRATWRASRPSEWPWTSPEARKPASTRRPLSH